MFESQPFDMLRLGLETLADVGGDPVPFQKRLEELEQRWIALKVEAAHLQFDLYAAVQAASKWRKGK